MGRGGLKGGGLKGGGLIYGCWCYSSNIYCNCKLDGGAYIWVGLYLEVYGNLQQPGVLAQPLDLDLVHHNRIQMNHPKILKKLNSYNSAKG